MFEVWQEQDRNQAMPSRWCLQPSVSCFEPKGYVMVPKIGLPAGQKDHEMHKGTFRYVCSKSVLPGINDTLEEHLQWRKSASLPSEVPVLC